MIMQLRWKRPKLLDAPPKQSLTWKKAPNPAMYRMPARNQVEEHGTGPDAATLVKKLRRVWTQREAHNVIRAMATKRQRTCKRRNDPPRLAVPRYL